MHFVIDTINFSVQVQHFLERLIEKRIIKKMNKKNKQKPFATTHTLYTYNALEQWSLQINYKFKWNIRKWLYLLYCVSTKLCKKNIFFLLFFGCVLFIYEKKKLFNKFLINSLLRLLYDFLFAWFGVRKILNLLISTVQNETEKNPYERNIFFFGLDNFSISNDRHNYGNFQMFV